jgi:predicted NUDIX family NTP pyrophosphohydrolase
MPAISAGLLLYRHADDAETGERGLEVLLVHPGGPYWAKKDAGAWSIPKGEVEPEELGSPGAPSAEPWRRPPKVKPRLRAAAADLFAVAKREFREETGFDPDALAAPGAAYVPLGGVKQRGHKIVYVWALEGDCDASLVTSAPFAMEWPPHSGRQASFPEVDRAAWFALDAGREKLLAAQRRFLEDLAALVEAGLSAGLRPPAPPPSTASRDGGR